MQRSINQAKPMLLFHGNYSFNPSTLNNNILTYIMAYKWQQSQTFEDTQDHYYTFQNWMYFIKRSIQLENLVNTYLESIVDGKPSINRYTIQLVGSWSLYGDSSTYFLNTRVVSAFDPEKLYNDPNSRGIILDDSIINQQINGHHKKARGQMADQDTDSQMMSKIFGQQFFVKDEFAGQVEPTSFLYLGRRVWTLNQMKYYNASPFSAIWASYFNIYEENCNSKGIMAKILNSDLNVNKHVPVCKNTYLKTLLWKMNQYRYNYDTKSSWVNGSVQPYRQGDPPNTLSWRQAKLIGNPFGPPFTMVNFKNVQILGPNGPQYYLIINMSDIVYDIEPMLQPGVLKKPIYPNGFKLILSAGQKQLKDFTQQIADYKDFTNIRGGIYPICLCLDQYNLINNNTVKLDFTFLWDNLLVKPVPFNPNRVFQQQLYTFEIIERFRKTVTRTCEFQIYGSKLGVPLNQDYKFTKLESTLSLDNTQGFTDYRYYYPNAPQTLRQLPPVYREFIQKLQYNNEQIFANATTYKEVIETWFNLGKGPAAQQFLDLIQNSINTLDPLIKQQNQKPIGVAGPYMWKKKESDELVKVQFADTPANIISFKNGYGKFQVQLNIGAQLTPQNNPRYPYIDSMCGLGYLMDGQRIAADFSVIFFEKEKIQPTEEFHQVDWKQDVGPELRMMALLYPKMQEIADIYNFTVKMEAMKRVFDVEDELNVRYMPSTREMSPFKHRQIRKWLYNPIYSKRLLAKNYNGAYKLLPKITNKQQLTKALKSAYRLELTTIPLYLMAMFTLQEGVENKLGWNILHTVAVDQMKHLLIVANILSALEQKIPSQPSEQNQYFIKQTMPDPVLLGQKFTPSYCAYPQLLQFLKIETPSEIYAFEFALSSSNNLKIEKAGDFSTPQERINRLNEYLTQIKSKSKIITIGDFYGNIMDGLWRLHSQDTSLFQNPQRLFSGNAIRQHVYPYFDGMNPVYDLRSALEQIRLIVEEGEGASIIDINGDPNIKCHFFAFLEMYVGYRVRGITRVIQNSKGIRRYKVTLNPKLKFHFDKNLMCNQLIKETDQYLGIRNIHLQTQIQKFVVVFDQTQQIRFFLPDEIQKKYQCAFNKSTVLQIQAVLQKSLHSESLEAIYRNINAYDSFNKIFKRVCMEIGELYNDTSMYNTYCEKTKKAMNLGQVSKVQEALKDYEALKVQRLENSIARMRNMRILAGYGLNPNTQPTITPPGKAQIFEQGIRPSFKGDI